MVDDALVAAEGIGLGKSASEAARNEGDCVVVAKTAEESVVGREGVVQTDVKLGFIQFSDRLAHEVETLSGIAGVRHRVEVKQGRTDAVDQAGRYFGAGSP